MAERPQLLDAKASAAQTVGVVMSFVIPARNEERLIARSLRSIHESLSDLFTYEIIVVDNGSSDSTPQISVAHGARLICQSAGTIGSLRNTGARAARGEILVFLDADVVLTEDWAARISSAIEALRLEPRSITGSICDVPPNGSWIERTWFAPRSGRYSSHIGTGHMVLCRSFFNCLGGFDEALVSGEDYDLSQRARSQGASIVIDDRLRVEHHGFPKTLGAFIKREMWHGTSDFRSVPAVLRSKVALISLVIAVLHPVVLIGLLTHAPAIAAGAVIAIMLLSVSSSIWKYRWERFHIIALNSLLFYLYYVARILSAFHLWTHGKMKPVS